MKNWLKDLVSLVFPPTPDVVARRRNEHRKLSDSNQQLRALLDKDPCADLPAEWECPPSWDDMLEVDRAYREHHG